jgi:hypothetical protein
MFDKDFKVKPIWIDDRKRWPPKQIDGGYFETCIRLNLDEKTQLSHLKLTENLKDVFDERLVLFLNQLQRITLEDRLNNEFKQHFKEVLHSNWVLVKAVQGSYVDSSPLVSSVKESYWCVVKDTFTPTVQRLRSMDVAFPTTVAVAVKFCEVENQGSSSRRSALVLENVDSLQPIYSFLPTKCTWFKFVIQGDFNLVSSRERIAEDNEWNLQLLKRVPALFVSLIRDLSKWVEMDGKVVSVNDSVDSLLSHVIAKFDVRVSFADVLNMLPIVPSQTDKICTMLVSGIYSHLQQVSFLASSSKELCKPCELVNVSHLSFDITAFLPEECLQSVTGMRYLAQDIVIEDKLLMLLKIRQFDVSIIISCCEKYSQRADQEGGPCNKHIVGLLMALALFVSAQVVQPRPSQTPPSVSSSKSSIKLVPSQVVKLPKVDAVAGLHREVANKLAKLNMWPVIFEGSEGLCTIDSTVLWLESEHVSMCAEQQHCVQILSNRMKFLNPAMFQLAQNLVPHGAGILRSFLIKTFRVNSADKSFFGGIDVISESSILHNVIFMCYEHKHDSVDRISSAAYLAFCFLSKSLQSDGLQQAAGNFQILKRLGVYIPVVIPCGNDSKNVTWMKPSVVRLEHGGKGEEEVHLGAEFNDSATAALVRAGCCTTALVQLQWVVVDPLVAALVLGNRSDIDYFIQAGDVEMTKFQHSRIASIRAPLLLGKFLLSLGVVSLSGVHYEDSMLRAPGFFRIVNHFMEHGVDIAASNGGLGFYLPEHKKNCEVLGVSASVFRTMQVIIFLLVVKLRLTTIF